MKFCQSNELLHAQLMHYASATDADRKSGVQVSCTQPTRIPATIDAFGELPLTAPLMDRLDSLSLTPVMATVLPTVCMGHNVCIHSKSTSIHAYLLPLLSHTFNLSRHLNGLHGPHVLLLHPNAQRCIQLEAYVQSLVAGMSAMKTVCLTGRYPLPQLLHRLRQGTQICIATPQKFLDVVIKKLPLLGARWDMIVLEQPECMTKHGMAYAMKQCMQWLLMDQGNKTRQWIVNVYGPSVRMDRWIEQWRLYHPVVVRDMGKLNMLSMGKHSIRHSVKKQTLVWVENDDKPKRLLSLLKDCTTVVVVSSDLAANLLCASLQARGWNAITLTSQSTVEQVQAVITPGTVAVVDTKCKQVIHASMLILYDVPASLALYYTCIGKWAMTNTLIYVFLNQGNQPLFKPLLTALIGVPVSRLAPLPLPLQILSKELRLGQSDSLVSIKRILSHSSSTRKRRKLISFSVLP
jgi:hypothetical protein